MSMLFFFPTGATSQIIMFAIPVKPRGRLNGCYDRVKLKQTSSWNKTHCTTCQICMLAIPLHSCIKPSPTHQPECNEQTLCVNPILHHLTCVLPSKFAWSKFGNKQNTFRVAHHNQSGLMRGGPQVIHQLSFLDLANGSQWLDCKNHLGVDIEWRIWKCPPVGKWI